MKPILRIKNFILMLTLAIAGLFMSTIAFAQDKDVNISVNTKDGGGFFSQPWVWIVGGAIFIIILVAILRPSGTKVIKE